jgi:hypothetical protein
MKRILILLLSLPVSISFAQGTVSFFNNLTTLVSAGPTGQQGLISGPRGSYYFGLFIAPIGTADPSQFAFTEFYATNAGAALPGRLIGRSFAVPGWAPGSTKSYLGGGGGHRALATIGISNGMTFAQGIVVFVNTPATLVSADPVGQGALIAGPPGSYYFGLLTAAPGTTNPTRFLFTGVYATNSALAGRIGPASYVPTVPGWATGVTMSFLVAGLGHDWNQQWINGSFRFAGVCSGGL